MMEIKVERDSRNQYRIETETPYSITLERDMIENGLRLRFVESSVFSNKVVYHVTYGRQYDVTSAIIDYESGDLDGDEIIELFQYLVDTGLAWSLQGHYGRMAFDLIDAGVVQQR